MLQKLLTTNLRIEQRWLLIYSQLYRASNNGWRALLKVYFGSLFLTVLCVLSAKSLTQMKADTLKFEQVTSTSHFTIVAFHSTYMWGMWQKVHIPHRETTNVSTPYVKSVTHISPWDLFAQRTVTIWKINDHDIVVRCLLRIHFLHGFRIFRLPHKKFGFNIVWFIPMAPIPQLHYVHAFQQMSLLRMHSAFWFVF